MPHAYALALRLRAAGVDDRLLADCLGIELEAVDPLLRLATTKLHRLRGSATGTGALENA